MSTLSNFGSLCSMPPYSTAMDPSDDQQNYLTQPPLSHGDLWVTHRDNLLSAVDNTSMVPNCIAPMLLDTTQASFPTTIGMAGLPYPHPQAASPIDHSANVSPTGSAQLQGIPNFEMHHPPPAYPQLVEPYFQSQDVGLPLTSGGINGVSSYELDQGFAHGMYPVHHNDVVAGPAYGHLPGGLQAVHQPPAEDASELGEAPIADGCYAQLIFRSLKEAWRDDCTRPLKEIYAWFEEKTNKATADTHGWRNSVRHNLSMNAAFENVKLPAKQGGPKTVAAWRLKSEYRNLLGVQSTTKFRAKPTKPKAAKRSPPDPTRQASGKKGGEATRSKRTKFNGGLDDAKVLMAGSRPRTRLQGGSNFGDEFDFNSPLPATMPPPMVQTPPYPGLATPSSHSSSPYFDGQQPFQMPFRTAQNPYGAPQGWATNHDIDAFLGSALQPNVQPFQTLDSPVEDPPAYIPNKNVNPILEDLKVNFMPLHDGQIIGDNDGIPQASVAATHRWTPDNGLSLIHDWNARH